MKTIQITGYEIDIKDSLTFGEREDLQKEIMKSAHINKPKLGAEAEIEFNPVAMIDGKYLLLEKFIVQIRKIEEGKDVEIISFSKEWLRSLPEDDGQKVVDESGIYPKKKDE
jgi:hypothetical protein